MTTTAQTRTRSATLWAKAQQLMPGGVNSPVRAFKAVGGDPVFIARGLGAYLWDEDDIQYVDYVGAWGPAILGHAHPEVVEAIREAVGKGLAFGAPTAAENDLALEVAAVARLNSAIATAVEAGDNGSRELFEKILTDEEHHIDWLEAQLHIIQEIGIENYLAQQVHEK